MAAHANRVLKPSDPPSPRTQPHGLPRALDRVRIDSTSTAGTASGQHGPVELACMRTPAPHQGAPTRAPMYTERGPEACMTPHNQPQEQTPCLAKRANTKRAPRMVHRVSEPLLMETCSTGELNSTDCMDVSNDGDAHATATGTIARVVEQGSPSGVAALEAGDA